MVIMDDKNIKELKNVIKNILYKVYIYVVNRISTRLFKKEEMISNQCYGCFGASMNDCEDCQFAYRPKAERLEKKNKKNQNANKKKPIKAEK